MASKHKGISIVTTNNRVRESLQALNQVSGPPCRLTDPSPLFCHRKQVPAVGHLDKTPCIICHHL